MTTIKNVKKIPERSTGVVRFNQQFLSIAMRTIESGERLYRLKGRLCDTPTRYSVQISKDKHIDMYEQIELEEILDGYPFHFINHSCEPNMYLNKRAFHAARIIHRGEELTFNYNTSEYDMAEPFVCRCGSLFCSGWIRGFKYLSYLEAQRLLPILPDYLRAELNQYDQTSDSEELISAEA